MAIRIEVYRVMPVEYRYDAPGHKFPACGLEFGVDIDLNGNADAACMAAGYVLRGIAAMYRGDRDKKIVAYCNGKRVAQYLGGPIEIGAEAAARLFDGCRPDVADEFMWCLRYARAQAKAA